MASFFYLTLDTTPPQDVLLAINGGDVFTSDEDVTLTISTSDEDSTGYQMKIWGTETAANEASAAWEDYAITKAITLPTGDGAKTVSIKIRDDVLNESDIVTAEITLDTKLPVVTTTEISVPKVSKNASADECKIVFKVDKDFVAYKIKVVPAEESLENEGVEIPTTNGSTNMSGANASGFSSETAIISTLKGQDLQAVSNGDGAKLIKVFVKDKAGNWSVA